MAGSEDRIEALLDRTKSLTGIARAAWITVILGCLYTWLTLAALDDVDLFVPERPLELPIVGTDISPEGFFLFAPVLLLAVYLYFQFMLAQLFRCYSCLCDESSGDACEIDGVAVNDRVEPWFMTALIPGSTDEFRIIRKIFAYLLCWFAAPVTIFAVGWRYLAAHDLWWTSYHWALLSTAIVSTLIFRAYRTDLFRGVFLIGLPRGTHAMRWPVAAAWIVLLTSAQVLVSCGLMHVPWPFDRGLLAKMSPHASLSREELSRRPAGWNEVRWHELEALIEDREADLDVGILPDCKAAEEAKEPESPKCSKALKIGRELDDFRRTRDAMIATILKAELGHIPARYTLPGGGKDGEDADETDDYCSNNDDLIETARDLRFADLRLADLTSAELRCADFRGADLRHARLENAKLEHAKLQEADLSDAVLVGAELSDAWLIEAILVKADMRGAQLDGARLERANLFEATLPRKLNGAYLSDAKLREAPLQHAELNRAYLDGADLRGAFLDHAYLSEAHLDDADLSGAILFKAVLTRAQLPNADLTSALLGEAVLSNATFTGAVLKGARLPQADLTEADLTNADLSSITNDSEEFPIEERVDLSQTTLTRANLTRANLTGANLSGADLTGAVLRGADLSRAIVSPEQLSRAFGDASAVLPEGVTPPVHWISYRVKDDAAFYGRFLGWAELCGLIFPLAQSNRELSPGDDWYARYDKIEWRDWAQPKTFRNCPASEESAARPAPAARPRTHRSGIY